MVEQLPEIDNLVPHSRDMSLLDTVLEANAEVLICELTVRSDGLFDSQGEVPALLGIEYMAQAVSAYSGLRRGNLPIRIGFLLGTRQFDTNVASFPCGATLQVKVCPVIYSGEGLAVFDCTVSGAGIEQSARIKAYEPADDGAYIASRGGPTGL
jgi:predicted hotdog family 3-hydroxylacyl-ACP dehydratase